MCSYPWYRPISKSVVRATLVTEDGRTVQGVGVSRWSEDNATENAIENVKELASETDVAVEVQQITLPNQHDAYVFLDKKVTRENTSSLGLPSIEVSVTDGERTADGKGRDSYLNALLRRPGQILRAQKTAVSSAVEDLRRTGTVELD